MIENKEQRVALIDADYLLYVVTNNKKDSEHIKTLDDCKAELDAKILEILYSTKATEYMLALTIGKNFRYRIYPEYKANRKYAEKPAYFTECRDYLKEHYNAISHSELEADDIVRICRNNLSNSFICSPDKDILNLEGVHYNPVKQEWKETSSSEAEDYFWKSMIIGDPADHIKGVAGLGKVAANKIIDNREIVLDEETYTSYYSARHSVVMMQYMDKYGIYNGVEEFYKNFKCLYILDKYEGFQLPKLNKFEQAVDFNEFKG